MKIQSYEEFWVYFLEQHSKPLTRRLHALGTIAGVFIGVIAILTGRPIFVLAGVAVGYAFAWTSHLFVEKNLPATFRYPWWSFVSEWRMTWILIRRDASMGGVSKTISRGNK